MISIATSDTRGLRGVPIFRNRREAAATFVLGTALAWCAFKFGSWALVHAVWVMPAGSGTNPCRAAAGTGACWAVIAERGRFMLLGVYPFDQQWRPVLVCLLFVALYAVSTLRAWWRPWLAGVWVAVSAAAIALLRGGLFGLSYVPSDLWGGLPLTFLLATIGFAAAVPLAVILALGRRSAMPAIRALCVAYIELVRGVPIISFLFMAAVLFPLFAPETFTIDKVARAQIALVMVISAYLAEVVRAGLASVPNGQYDAAAAVGLGFWPAMLLIVLPQAIRVAIPALVNTFVAFFKDTSLVMVIGMFDLLGAARAVLVDPQWVGFGVEVYLFVAAIYFVFCYAVSRFGHRIEGALTARGHC